MRKLLLLASLLFSVGAFGQVSATFTIPDTSATSGSEVCLPVTTRDFSNGVAFSFAINWSNENPNLPSNLTYLRVQNFNAQLNAANTFNQSNFNETQVSSNLLVVEWQSYQDQADCETSDVTIVQDGTTLFEICFEVDGDLADQTFLRFQDFVDTDPFDEIDEAVEVTFIKNESCDGGTSAFPALEDGSVTVGVDPVKLSLSFAPATLVPGDQFCVDINVESGFNGLTGLQFPIVFNTDVLRVVADERGFAGNSTYPADQLPGHSPASYQATDNGRRLSFQWSDFGGMRYDVPDGSKLATICFDIIGECGESASLFLEAQPEGAAAGATEATGGPAGVTPIPVVSEGITMRVSNCREDAFDIPTTNCPDGPVEFGDKFCIDVRAGDDFDEMRFIDYLILFDEDIIAFDRVGDPSNPLSNEDIDRNNFDLTQRDRGILAFEYPGALGGNDRLTIPEGEIVYQLCFEVVGFSGTTSIQFAPRGSIRGGRPTLIDYPGINPTSCPITISNSDGIRLTFDEPTSFQRGEESCVNLFADGFDEVTAFTLPIIYRADYLNYTRVTPNPVAPGITVNDAISSPGFQWLVYDGPAFTLPEGEPLATVCFDGQPDAEPGICDSLDVFATAAQVTRNMDGVSTVATPTDIRSGDYCILFPDGFGLDIGSAEGVISGQTCVPVSVNSFDDITSLNVNFTYPPELMQLDTVLFRDSWPGTIADFDLSNAGTGLVNWAMTSDFAPIPDSTIIFELCFETQTTTGCGEIVASDGAFPPTTTQTSDNGSIIYGNGELCVRDRIIIENLEVVPATCSDNIDGEVRVTYGDRGNTEAIFIQASNPRRQSDSTSIVRLRPGMQNLLFFNASGSVRLDTTVMVTIDSTNIPFADAGEDKTLSCGDNAVALLEGRNNQGSTYRVFFLGNNIRRPLGDADDLVGGNAFTQRVSEAGNYLLEVRSERGCPAYDTVSVAGLGQPSVTFNDTVPSISCTTTEVTVSAQGADHGPGFETYWERVNFTGTPGEYEPVDTITSDLSFTTERFGFYRYSVADVTNGCAVDTVVRVRLQGLPPNVNVPATAQLSCSDNTALLSAGTSQSDVNYSWTRFPSGEEVSDSSSYLATTPGTYVVRGEENGTGCAAADTIVVEANAGAPVPTPVQDTVAFSCTDTLDLVATYANVSSSTSYRWSRTAESGFIYGTSSGQPVARVSGPGIYTITVDNGGCADSAQIVVTEAVFPDAEAGENVMLACNQSVLLEGSSGAAVDFAWTREGQAVPQGESRAVNVELPGTYLLTVMDQESGCTATDSVTVTAAEGFPTYGVDNEVTDLGCEGSTVALEVQPQPTGADYSYAWSDSLGNPLTTVDTSAVEVGAEGTYLVRVTNNTTGCFAEESIRVRAEATRPPSLFFSSNSLEIDCESREAEIIPGGSSTGPQFLYTYGNVTGGEPIEQARRIGNNLFVSEAGVYSLTILNTNTNCSSTGTIEVGPGPDLPQVTFNAPDPLDCNDRSTEISIDVVGGADQYTVEWSAPFGADPIEDGTTSFTATDKGTYSLLVYDENFCRFEGRVQVIDLTDSIADIAILPADTFDCGQASLTIDASFTDVKAPGGRVQWTALDGNTVISPTSLTPSVTGPGRYELAVFDDSSDGCAVRDTLTVPAGPGTPLARPGDDREVGCGETVSLDASQSSASLEGNFVYQWSVIAGAGSVLTGENTLTPTVQGPGTYQLVVTSTESACADSATVSLNLEALAQADIGTDRTTCDEAVSISGNLPPGSTSRFESFDDDFSLFSVDGNTATVTEVGEGFNLVYILSADGCGDYSSDTIRIEPEEAPMANNDLLEISEGSSTGSINVLDNDLRSGPVTVTLLSEPEFGTVESNLNGLITFDSPVGTRARTTISYQVCSNTCPDLCSEATLTIVVDDGRLPQTYNAFTPNGDGFNDEFVFEVLEVNPDEFPDNELIIFNRWGDIIFESAPYQNDWTGLNSDGSPVPEGTYYYILRLDIGEGDIIRGDVTVIR